MAKKAQVGETLQTVKSKTDRAVPKEWKSKFDVIIDKLIFGTDADVDDSLENPMEVLVPPIADNSCIVLSDDETALLDPLASDDPELALLLAESQPSPMKRKPSAAHVDRYSM